MTSDAEYQKCHLQGLGMFCAAINEVSLNLVVRRVGRVKIFDLSTWVDGSDPSDPYPAGNFTYSDMPLRVTL